MTKDRVQFQIFSDGLSPVHELDWRSLGEATQGIAPAFTVQNVKYVPVRVQPAMEV